MVEDGETQSELAVGDDGGTRLLSAHSDWLAGLPVSLRASPGHNSSVRTPVLRVLTNACGGLVYLDMIMTKTPWYNVSYRESVNAYDVEMT